MQPSRVLSKGDVHLLLAGVLFGAFVLTRLTDPSDYGMTLHPRLDKVWSMYRIVISATWLLLAFLVITLRSADALARSFSYAAASTTAAGLIVLSILYPQSSSFLAIGGSLAVYATTSGTLCLTIRRPVPAALLGVVCFALQVLADGVVHFMTGVFRIH